MTRRSATVVLLRVFESDLWRACGLLRVLESDLWRACGLLLDHRPRVLPGERPRELAALQPVDDLHAFHVTGVLPRREELPVEHQVLRHVGEHRGERRAPYQP